MSKNKSEFDADHMTIEWNGFGDALGNDLWQFYMSKEYSDVTICTEDGREIKSHRILLAMCSIYLHELFQRHNGSNIIGKSIVIPSINRLCSMDRSIYTISNCFSVLVKRALRYYEENVGLNLSWHR